MTWTEIRPLGLVTAGWITLATVVVSITSMWFRRARLVLVSNLLVRGVSLCAAFAILSLRWQAAGLIGSSGLLPFTNTLQAIDRMLFQHNQDSDLSEEEDNVRHPIAVINSILKVLQAFLPPSITTHISHFLHTFSSADNIQILGYRLLAEKFRSSLGLSSTDTDSSSSDLRPEDVPANESLLNWLSLDLTIALVGVIYPHPLIFMYLSHAYWGYKVLAGTFLSFQWDVLLIEALAIVSVLALTMAPRGTISSLITATAITAVKLTVLRLMFGSGLVKAYGSDAAWYNPALNVLTTSVDAHGKSQFSLQTTDNSGTHTTLSEKNPFATRNIYAIEKLDAAIKHIVNPDGTETTTSTTAAMAFHFYTQPLPNKIAMYIQRNTSPQMFRRITQMAVAGEIFAPLLSIIPFHFCEVLANLHHIGLMWGIGLSGYYGFFNILTIVLCLSAFTDDDFFTIARFFGLSANYQRVFEELLYANTLWQPPKIRVAPLTIFRLVSNIIGNMVAVVFISIILVGSVGALLTMIARSGFVLPSGRMGGTTSQLIFATRPSVSEQPEPLSTRLTKRILKTCLETDSFLQSTVLIGGQYGLFAHMTKQRHELRFQVSADREEWHDIVFRYKPDSKWTPPKAVIPFFHMPRLDWQMWFLALRPPSVSQYPQWAFSFFLRVLENCPEVTSSLLSPESAELISRLHSQVNISSPSPIPEEYKEDILQRARWETNTNLQAQEDRMNALWLRADVVDFEFNLDPNYAEEDAKEGETVDPRPVYWKTKRLLPLLGPTQRPDLIFILEQFQDRGSSRTSKKRR